MDRRWLLPLLTLLLAAPAPGRAADDDPDASRVETTREGRAAPATQKARRLAREYDASPADVQALRDRGMGWGEIRRALGISQRSGKPLSEIVELRDAGMGWGEIASRYNIDVDDTEPKDAAALRREERLRQRRPAAGPPAPRTPAPAVPEPPIEPEAPPVTP